MFFSVCVLADMENLYLIFVLCYIVFMLYI